METVVAASLVWVGVDCWRTSGVAMSGRWTSALPVFAFGLVHGPAFARAFTELSWPAGSAVLAALVFNAGVDLAQLATLLPVYGLQRWATARGRELPLRRALGAVTAVVGSAYALDRALGLGRLPG